MTVSIDIDLDSGPAQTELGVLKGELEALDDDFDFNFGIDDDLADKIEKLTKDLKKIKVDVDYTDLKKAAALKAMLQGDIDSDLNINTDKALSDIEESLDPGGGQDGRLSSWRAGLGGGDSDGGGSDGSDNVNKNRFSSLIDSLSKTIGSYSDGRSGGSRKKYPDSMWKRSSRLTGWSDRLGSDRVAAMRKKNFMSPVMDRNDKRRRGYNLNPDIGSLKAVRKKVDIDTSYGDSLLSIGDRRENSAIGGMKKKLKNLIPSMSTFYSIIAAIIPLLAVMVTQLVGVAAAMGAVALAGASMIGLGLVGHGDDMAESWSNAQSQLSDLKDDLFSVFQPTMQTFAPIQERFFEMMPEQLNKIANAMEGLTVYSDTLFKSFRGITDFIASGVDGMVKYEEIISQIALRFGSLVGSSVADFFGWLIVEIYETQDTLVKLGKLVKNLLVVFYRVSRVITAIVSSLWPLAAALSFISQLLNNKVVIGILSFISVAGVLTYVVTGLMGAVTTLTTIGFAGLLSMLTGVYASIQATAFSMIMATSATYGFAHALATAIAVGTMGIGVIGGLLGAMSAVDSISADANMNHSVGGNMPTGGSGAGAGSGATQNVVNEGDTYNVEVNGGIDNPTEEGLADIFGSESAIRNSREHPGHGA